MNLARVALAIMLVTLPSPGRGQDNPPVPPPTLTAEKVKQLQESVQESDLADEPKQNAVDMYTQAIAALKQAEEFAGRGRKWQSAVDSAESRAAELQAKLQQLRESTPQAADPATPLAKLEQQLAERQAEVAKLKQAAADADGAIAKRTERRKTIGTRLTDIEQQLAEVQQQLQQPPADGEPPEATEARRTLLQATLEQLRAEQPALELELAADDAENARDILRLIRDEASLRLKTSEESLQALQQLVQSQRASEASQQISDAAELAAAETDPQLRAIALRNVELAEQFQELTQLMEAAEGQLTAAQATYDYWAQIAQVTKEKVDAIGLTDTIGAMLRQQKSSLPNPYRYQAKIDRRSEKIAIVQLELMELDDERRNLRPPELPPEQAEEMQQRAEELIARQAEHLSTVIRTQRSYFDMLVELSNTEQRIINQTQQHREFIDERILWVRSGPPLYSSFTLASDDVALLDGHRWMEALQSIRADLFDGAVWYLLALAVLVVLLANGRRLRRQLRTLGATAESGRCVDVAPTLRAISYTILIALPWPMLLTFLAWRFSQLPTDNPVAHSLAVACSTVAAIAMPLEFFRQVCQPKGLGESHFNWPEASLKLVRRSIRSLAIVGLPMFAVIGVTQTDGVRHGLETFYRLTFIAATVVVSVFAGRVLSPRRGILSTHLMRRPHGWAAQLQAIWYWAAILLPLMLGLIAFLGYTYTAQQLAWRLHGTVVVLALVATATAFFTRILLVQRRRINIEASRQRHAAAAQGDDLLAETAEIPTAEELRSQIAQSRSLLRMVMIGVAMFGIWMTWSDVLPALGFLEQRPLWRSVNTVVETTTDDQGNVSYKSLDVLDNVTIADCIFAVLIGIATAIAAKNIPGLLEISLLQRLPIEASVRYAIATVASYIIIIVGLTVAASSLGIHWKQIQWMAAALTFGLAFGLQEMFANFVAGIIILFERPIRVGDIVTIDEVTGTVSRVQIRATTITNWDRKDYLVPNKDLITGRVLNWTLSNRVNRIVIPVGVAYGSDKTETVRQILRSAIEHPLVVDDPAPTVTFEEFGDSSLKYILRCYVAMEDLPQRLQIIHELHTSIDDAFRQANIEIPFPQRDLHLRSVDPDARLG